MTQGPIRAHLLRMTAMMLVGMLMQTAYSLIDIYWVGRLGGAAVAAVSVVSSLTFVIIGVTQMLTVGAVALISQAKGAGRDEEVQRIFNQAQSLSVLTGLLFLGLCFLGRDAYLEGLTNDAETLRLAREFYNVFMPAMALQFSMVGLGAALRGVGNMKPGMVAQMGSVLLNMLLAPFLVFGWAGLPALGVAGAGWATLIATVAALAGMAWYLARAGTYLRNDFSQWKPQGGVWSRMLMIGAPAGGEFVLMTVILSVVYGVIKTFGPEAQAGFGIGMRVMQAWFMPAICLSFAIAAVAGQNFGAKNAARVRETALDGGKLSVGFMLLITVLAHIAPEGSIRLFSADPQVIAVGADYLRIVSFNFLSSGVIMVANGLYQGMGNTLPSLLASATRLFTYILPVLWLSGQTGYTLTHIWWLSVASVGLQMLLVLWLLRRELARRLPTLS